LKKRWGIIVSFIVVAVALGIAYRVLGLAGASMLGSRYVVAEAVTAIVTLIALALLAFVGVRDSLSWQRNRFQGTRASVVAIQKIIRPLIQLSDIVAQLIIAIEGGSNGLFAFAKALHRLP